MNLTDAAAAMVEEPCLDQLRIIRFDRSHFHQPPRYRAKLGNIVGWGFVRGDGRFHKNEITAGTTIKAIKARFPSARCVRSTIGHDKLYLSDADWVVLEMIAEHFVAKTR